MDLRIDDLTGDLRCGLWMHNADAGVCSLISETSVCVSHVYPPRSGRTALSGRVGLKLTLPLFALTRWARIIS
jgi:hypothetical protein